MMGRILITEIFRENREKERVREGGREKKRETKEFPISMYLSDRLKHAQKTTHAGRQEERYYAN